MAARVDPGLGPGARGIAIAAQLAVAAGETGDVRERAGAAGAALRRLGLVSDGDALARWSTGQALLAIDRLYVA